MLNLLIFMALVIFLLVLYFFALSKLKKYFSRKDIGTLKKIYRITNKIIILYLLVVALGSIICCAFFIFANLSTYNVFVFWIIPIAFMTFIFSQFDILLEKVYGTAKNIEKERNIIRKIDELISYLAKNDSLLLSRNCDKTTASSDLYYEAENELLKTCSWSLKLLDKEQKKVSLVLNDSYGGILYSKEFTLTNKRYNELINSFNYSIE